jgi:hypothetical protein
MNLLFGQFSAEFGLSCGNEQVMQYNLLRATMELEKVLVNYVGAIKLGNRMKIIPNINKIVYSFETDSEHFRASYLDFQKETPQESFAISCRYLLGYFKEYSNIFPAANVSIDSECYTNYKDEDSISLEGSLYSLIYYLGSIHKTYHDMPQAYTHIIYSLYKRYEYIMAAYFSQDLKMAMLGHITYTTDAKP